MESYILNTTIKTTTYFEHVQVVDTWHFCITYTHFKEIFAQQANRSFSILGKTSRNRHVLTRFLVTSHLRWEGQLYSKCSKWAVKCKHHDKQKKLSSKNKGHPKLKTKSINFESNFLNDMTKIQYFSAFLIPFVKQEGFPKCYMRFRYFPWPWRNEIDIRLSK